MRIWDLDPGFLNDRSLLGEHRELHGLFSIHVNGKKGYSRHPETVRWQKALSGLAFRHDLLVSEMALRGFNHQSPLPPLPDRTPAWPEIFIDPPEAQFSLLREKYRDKAQGRIALPKAVGPLWASHKYSVMARDPELYRTLGPRVADKTIGFPELGLLLVRVLRQKPARGRLINALDHLWGYLPDSAGAKPDDPDGLLAKIRAQAPDIPYLKGSTAIGELQAWIDP